MRVWGRGGFVARFLVLGLFLGANASFIELQRAVVAEPGHKATLLIAGFGCFG